ncbi:MAG: SDR family oxidoreductase [Megasphaera sp.]|jgi:NAD(P)-dependent dehydrogenase (short-subunit alcohol dehydrogenase family)|nr:SDR family oxidoreductase [Megasphaera sp.]
MEKTNQAYYQDKVALITGAASGFGLGFTEKILELVQLNYLGVVYGTMAALPFLEAQGWGHVINTASAGGLMPFAYQSAYASTKAAVISFTQCLDMEYSDRDIHFTSISPPNVATNIYKADVIAKMRQEGYTEEEIEDIIKDIPVPKDAIPLNEAVDYIFANIPQQEVNIIVGDEPKVGYALYKKDYNTFKECLEYLKLSRKAYFEAIARGENPAFPG